MEFSVSNESCRVCLRKTPTGKYLLEPVKGKEHTEQRTLLSLYNLCTGFTDPPWTQEHETNTFFPQKICAACEQLLLTTYEFGKLSKKSEKVLQHILLFYNDDESSCIVLEESNRDDQLQEHCVDESIEEYEQHHARDQEAAEIVDDRGLELLQEAALLSLKKETETSVCISAQEECPEYDAQPKEYDSVELFLKEETVLEECNEQPDLDEFIDFESLVDEDEEEEPNGGEVFYESRNPSLPNHVDCPDCGKLVSTSYLSKHRDTHQALHRFECDVCKMRFTFLENLTKHKRIHENDKRYECPYCQELFLHWTSRRYHIERVHTKEKRFACEYCGAKFRQSSHYQIHLRRHTGSTPYPCSMCEKSFVTSSSRKEHMRSHSDKKEFQCKHCRKRYKTSKSLQVHMKTHSNLKEYVCSECEKAFTQNHSLRTHQMNEHPGLILPPPGTVMNIRVINRLRSEEPL
ncbi:zinc finger protein 771-like [Anopheles ziemanni]|uniref:zinc finger protein 771-like n=1 Tax=Anopheles coustani TaxID=139045 RepID=UPI00265AE07E|nr:zinc finger protein 771-like [Anopheles coustani]XP_058170427.1 zinc finger protein 771-like [Anopheles ziemanni]